MIPFPEKKYSILYADPPWSYRDKCKSGNRGAEYKYPCMSLEEICTLPILQITEDNAALFLWATKPLLPQALEVLRSWGFTYKGVAFTWVKLTKNGKIFMGMGNYTRSNAELCLLGLKGRLKRESASISDVLLHEVGKHSQKPPVVREKITDLFGDLPRIELFARERSPGWDAWGNEV